MTQDNLTQEQKDFINSASFGAVLGPVYALASELYKHFWLFLIPFYNIYLFFKLIIKGRKMAWEVTDRSYESFYKHQKKLSSIGKIVVGIYVAYFLVVIPLILVTSIVSSNPMRQVAKDFSDDVFNGQLVSEFATQDVVIDTEYLNTQKDTRGNYNYTSFNGTSVNNDTVTLTGSASFDHTELPVCITEKHIGGLWKVTSFAETCADSDKQAY